MLVWHAVIIGLVSKSVKRYLRGVTGVSRIVRTGVRLLCVSVDQGADDDDRLNRAFDIASEYNARANEAYRKRFDGVQAKAALLITFGGSAVLFAPVYDPWLHIPAVVALAITVGMGIRLVIPGNARILNASRVTSFLMPDDERDHPVDRASLAALVRQEAATLEGLERSLMKQGVILRGGFVLLSVGLAIVLVEQLIAAVQA